MNIMILARTLSTELGGIEKCLIETCTYLVRQGHSLVLVYDTAGDQLETYRQLCTSVVCIKSYKVGIKFVDDVKKILNQPADLIYTHYYDNFFFGTLIARIKKIKFFVHLHLPAPVETGQLRKMKQAWTLSQIDQYFAVSQAVKTDWMSILKVSADRINVVYNGINLENFKISDDITAIREKWGIDDSTKVISYVGRLEDYKGVEHLIHVVDQLRQSEFKIKLIIAGKSIISGSEYEYSLHHLVDRLNLGSHVQFVGHVANSEEIYQLSDILVVPSLWLEAFGLVIVEAMACGIPVIASRVGGIPEILSGDFQSQMFEPGDEHHLFQLLKKSLDWRINDPSLGEKCHKHVMDYFSSSMNLHKLEKLILKDCQ